MDQTCAATAIFSFAAQRPLLRYNVYQPIPVCIPNLGKGQPFIAVTAMEEDRPVVQQGDAQPESWSANSPISG